LRVQSEEYHQRGDLILQGLLADSRVWWTKIKMLR
jgi:hypothetical protein